MWKTRKDVFEHSYSEVLSALKHQDDKLGRALTAVAFLTAAGVALYTQIGARSTVTFDDQSLGATAFFFMAFLFSVVLSLLVILAAIGPSATYRAKSGEWRSERSLIFYASIRGDDDWGSYLGMNALTLEQKLSRNFHHEAKVIAKRVHYKVARSREAGAFIYLAVTSLVLLGVFSMETISAEMRWWVASGTVMFLAALPLWDLYQMYAMDFVETRPDSASYIWLGVALLTGMNLLRIGPEDQGQWIAMAYSLTLVLLSRLAFVEAGRGRLLIYLAVVGIFIHSWIVA